MLALAGIVLVLVPSFDRPHRSRLNGIPSGDEPWATRHVAAVASHLFDDNLAFLAIVPLTLVAGALLYKVIPRRLDFEPDPRSGQMPGVPRPRWSDGCSFWPSTASGVLLQSRHLDEALSPEWSVIHML